MKIKTPTLQNRKSGYQLKLKQRTWRIHGIRSIVKIEYFFTPSVL